MVVPQDYYRMVEDNPEPGRFTQHIIDIRTQERIDLREGTAPY